MSKLNPYQLLFFNREINFGNPGSNILKGNAELCGMDFDRLSDAIFQVLSQSEWTYLSIHKETLSWRKNDYWNGRFEKHIFHPDIAIDKELWSVQLIKTESDKCILHLYLHHCLGDAHSFNLFWRSVYNQYKNGSFEQPLINTEVEQSGEIQTHSSKKLNSDLGIAAISRISIQYNARIKNQLDKMSENKGATLMAILLEFIENALRDCEKELETPLKIGIALRNRKNRHQKNYFQTMVNFLPLSEDKNLTMLQRIKQLFRNQDYPLLNYLEDNALPVAFNVLFSYQKENYSSDDNFEANFNFEASSSDDNIIGIHLLEYDNNCLTLHFDYRRDIASESFWQTFLRILIRKIIATICNTKDRKELKLPAQLFPEDTPKQDFWFEFNQADPDKIALICKGEKLTFAEIKNRIAFCEFPAEQKLLTLKPERTIDTIVNILAAWKKGMAVSFHDIKPDILTNINSIAYVSNTSGTSGIQKSILTSFDGLSTLIPDWKRIYNTENTLHLCLADLQFDVFFGDLLRTILSGETLLLATEEERLDASKIENLIAEYGVTHFESTPSFLAYLLPNLSRTHNLRLIVCGSEPILKGFYELLQNKKFKGIDFYNSYGLTECSIDSAVSKLYFNHDDRFPSGFPIGDQRISIRNAQGELKPMGVWGEICIGGSCVGRIVNQEMAENYYRTGDCGMITAKDGLIVNGRINDDFIKINGRRVPVTLIEQYASEINSLKTCICIAVDNLAVLFYNGIVNQELISKKLSEKLSKYQLPDAYFCCDQWPVNQNGKTDRKKLKEWYKIQNKDKISWQPGASDREKIIYNCLISRNKTFGSAEDTLISFGWNSIELLSLANELNMKGVYLPLTSFIQNPSIEFILSSEKKEENNKSENPLAEDFDIDDILNVLND